MSRAHIRTPLVVAFVAFVALACVSRTALCHGVRTASVDLDEAAPGVATVRLRKPAPDPLLALATAEPCTLAPIDGLEGDGGALLVLRCPGTIEGASLRVEGLGPIHSEAAVVARFADGHRQSHLVTASHPSWSLPGAATPARVGASYVVLGVRHILTGYDHQLFLLALVLLLRRRRAVIAAETAFTVSHSASFSATALGLVHVAPAPAEACIALSLVLVALDIGRTEAEPPSLRHGAALAFVFGLVHGLGFAGGLRELGLPDQDVASALVGFAAGVELGQIAFLAGVLACVSLVSLVSRMPRWPSALAPALRAVIGGVSCSLLIERLLACLGRGG